MERHVAKPSIANLLDYVGRNERRRKQKVLYRDTREPGGKSIALEDIILRGRGYTIEARALRIGDWSWELRPESVLFRLGYREVVMERKTLADLRDVERLQSQLNRAYVAMAEGSPMFFILLIDLSVDADDPRSWSDEQIANAKLSVQIDSHFHVTESEPGRLAGRIESIYLWSQKNNHSLDVV
jgi:ERCC4-type nuclease